MNYDALTEDELAAMCRTDEGARQYVAQNAEEILEYFCEMRDHWHQETWDEAHRDGQDVGSNEERDQFRATFGDRLVETHHQLSCSGKEDMTPLRADCLKLLVEMIEEYGLK